MDEQILISILSMAGLGMFFAVILAMVDRRFKVEEDPKVASIMDVIPGANCAACGFKGCFDMAQHLAKGDAKIEKCPIAKGEAVQKINDILGVESQETKTKQFAIVHCGSKNSQKKRGSKKLSPLL